jgi:hypothetical protein
MEFETQQKTVSWLLTIHPSFMVHWYMDGWMDGCMEGWQKGIQSPFAEGAEAAAAALPPPQRNFACMACNWWISSRLERTAMFLFFSFSFFFSPLSLQLTALAEMGRVKCRNKT